MQITDTDCIGIREYLEIELKPHIRKTTVMFLPLDSAWIRTEVTNFLKDEEYTDYCQFALGDRGIGNRAPNSLHFQMGIVLIEQHILLICPQYEPVRVRLGMSDMIRGRNFSLFFHIYYI